jgi:hypothetical protein
MLWILSWLFFATPQGTVTGNVVPPSYLPLYQAAASFSSGLDAPAFTRINPLLEPAPSAPDGAVQPDPPERLAARMLLAVHHACAGRLERARLFFNLFSTVERDQLSAIFLGKRVISIRPAQTTDEFWVQVDGILGVYTRCQPDGLLFFADQLHGSPHTGADVRQALFEWLPSLFTGDRIPDPAAYSGVAVYFALAAKRLRHHWLSEPFSDAELALFTKLTALYGLQHPYPSGTPWRISALVPVTGAWAPLGLQMLQALAAARAEIPALEILVHNTNSSPGTALALLQEEILLKDRPLAVILPPDPESAKVVLASGAELVFLSAVDGSDLPATPGVFHAQPTRKARVEALVLQAVSEKATRLGVLSPDTPAGRDLAAAAVAAIKKNRGTVVFSSTYDPAKLPARLNLPNLASAHGVIIPDAAERVVALARRLAVAGAFPAPIDARGKGFLLLATAEALSPIIVSQNARYLAGAIFAPGFYSGAPDPEFNTMNTYFTRIKAPVVLSVASETYWWIKSLPIPAVRSAGSRTLLQDAISRWNQGPGLGPVFDAQGKSQRRPRLYRFLGGQMTRIP